jgi:Skp family chaperone for outer membrane proteins
MAALGVGLYVGRGILAQQGGTARPTSKIAVVNLPLVIKNYKKYETYEKELKKFVEGYQGREAELRTEMDKAQKDAAGGTDRDGAEQKLKGLKRAMEDLSMEFKKELAKRTDTELVQLYKEVEAMVAQVARYNGFEMVLQYGDVLDKKDAYNPMVIQKKVFGGMCLPMYAVNGLDISQQVSDNLNYYLEHPVNSNANH